MYWFQDVISKRSIIIIKKVWYTDRPSDNEDHGAGNHPPFGGDKEGKYGDEKNGGYGMKKLAILLFTVLFVTALSFNAFAAGGKVRGEKGKGAVNQVQVKDPPPFIDD